MKFATLTPAAADISLAEQAYLVLRDRLVMLDIAPGSPMNEQQLSLELEMGRTPIRESLKRLEIDHLVVSYPRQGTFASRIDIGDLAAISEMRLVLEPHAAERAAYDASAESRAILAAWADEIRQFTKLDYQNRELIELDLSVHRAIYQTLDNPYMQETLIRLDNLATRLWLSVLDRVPSVAHHVAEHVELIEAIVAGDGAKAAAITREHIVNFETAVRAAL